MFISCVACCFKHFNHFLGGLHFIWWYFMTVLRKVLSKISRISGSKNALWNFFEFRIQVLLMNVSNCCVEFFSVLFWCWIIGTTIKTSQFYSYVHLSLVEKEENISHNKYWAKYAWIRKFPDSYFLRYCPYTEKYRW